MAIWNEEGFQRRRRRRRHLYEKNLVRLLLSFFPCLSTSLDDGERDVKSNAPANVKQKYND